MKNPILFLALLFSSVIVSAQDTLPNPGFEEWSFTPAAGGGYNSPAGWRTYNPLTSALQTYTAFKTDSPEVHSGSHAIKLVSKEFAGSFAPAVVTLGSISINGIAGGIPINSRPSTVTGWYKYEPVGNDQALFEIYLYKAGVVIGSGTFNQADSVNAWTQFTLPVTYTTSDIPDTVLINFFSSTGDVSPPSEVNSTLYIDDVAYDFSSGFRDLASGDAIKILPNPASEKITIEIQNADIESFIIYSLDGKKVKEIAVRNGMKEFEVDDLIPGKYILATNLLSGKTLTGLFEIQR